MKSPVLVYALVVSVYARLWWISAEESTKWGCFKSNEQDTYGTTLLILRNAGKLCSRIQRVDPQNAVFVHDFSLLKKEDTEISVLTSSVCTKETPKYAHCLS
ncbi:hypothetical protein F9802_17840 [Bacillus aerolatus]|uniref:Uncharacterized protein n=1 Tax=Bacillus aerolatus TaxID=2653354 RepID=A0A6I1FBM5_9BACI|nr:hypothetical protein [Bacillus aerolatus]KAB7704410.1 hypothetical protein F9802_17840 [Bacillus aerolatus]